MYIDVRSIFIALPILIINPAAAIANTTLDSFTNGSSVIWTTYTTTTIVPGVKGFLWILDAGQWREVYAGPALTLAPWCEASLGLGIERDASTVAPRFAGSAWFGNGSLSWITVIEYGSLGGAWYLSTLTQKINGISFGVRAKRFVGEGLYGEWQSLESLSLYGVGYLFDFEAFKGFTPKYELGFRLTI